jgi:hypothetical protein
MFDFKKTSEFIQSLSQTCIQQIPLNLVSKLCPTNNDFLRQNEEGNDQSFPNLDTFSICVGGFLWEGPVLEKPENLRPTKRQIIDIFIVSLHSLPQKLLRLVTDYLYWYVDKSIHSPKIFWTMIIA